MANLFSTTTNGGANSFSLDNNDELVVGGQGVGGTAPVDAVLLAELFGGELTSGQDVSLAPGGDLSDAEISIKATGAAGVFEALVEVGTGTGNLNQVDRGVAGPASAEKIDSKIGDLELVLDRAKVRQEKDGEWEVQFGGKDVKGAVATNGDFATKAEAEAFLVSLKDLFDAGPGSRVVVEDDDLVGGTFEFTFEEKFYRDVNPSKIEAALAGTDISFDGSIDSKAEGAAANLALVLDRLQDGETFIFDELEDVASGRGNVNQVENGIAGPATAEQLAQKIVDVDVAVANANIRQETAAQGGDFEVAFGGQGVKGSVTTNAEFDSAAEAQVFIDTLNVLQGGLLDDALF
jgi:hypothetical protein